MKAIILAAGKGERLRPLTDNIPKCLVALAGRPLLAYWLDICRDAEVDEVLINGHYLAEKVANYLSSIQSEYDFPNHFVYEKQLYGTGGTLREQYNFVKDEEYFFFCHGDNFSNINISDFCRFHEEKDTELSVALFRSEVPKQCGIAEEIAEDGRIIRFTEKPENPKSDLASAAIFLMSPELIQKFPNKKVIDFSKEVLPRYQGQMYGYQFDGFNIDIGTPEQYHRAGVVAEELQKKAIS